MGDGITKSVYLLNYIELIGWVAMICGAVGLVSKTQIFDQGIFQVALAVGVLFIIMSRFFKWIFRLKE